MTTVTGTKESRGFQAAVVGVALLGLFVNFFRLNAVSVLSDEPTYAAAAWRYVHGTVGPTPANAHASSADNFEHPPLAKYLFGLAQLVVGHPSIGADRAVAAGCAVLTAAVLGLWLGHVVGRWAGLVSAALMLLLPEAVSPAVTRFARTGMLDPVAELFMTISIAAAWYWFATTPRYGWRWATVTGIAVGLAAGSKENGFLGVVGPVLVALAVVAIRNRSRFLERLAQAAVALVACLVTFLALYVPLGAPLSRVSYLLAFQRAHSAEGHLIGFAGRVSQFPPWWTNFWFAAYGMGAVTTLILLAAALIAIFTVRQPVTWWLAAVLTGPVVFHCFVAKVVLPFYWTMWLPPFIGLAAVGIVRLVQAALASSGARRFGVAALAVVLVIPPASVMAAEVRKAALLVPVGPITLPALFARSGVTGDVAVAGLPLAETGPYTGSRVVHTTLSPSTASWQAIVLGQPRCRTLRDRGIRALIALNLPSGSLREIHTDRILTVYRVEKHMQLPTPAQVASVPTGSLADHC